MHTSDKPTGKKLPAKIAIALIIAIMTVAVAVPALAGGGLDSCEEKCGAYTKCMAYETGSRDEYWCYEGQHFCWEVTQVCSLFW